MTFRDLPYLRFRKKITSNIWYDDIRGIQDSVCLYDVMNCNLVTAYQRVGEMDRLYFRGRCDYHTEYEVSLSPLILFIQIFWYLAVSLLKTYAFRL
jgi:hypothetical protein